jgi:DNA (cytosine-5)-methyltransferase 1
VDTAKTINTVEWFFGYGGNHLGLKRVLPNLRLLAACEIEEFAVENILAKMEAGHLEAAPIWSDCKTFPQEPFVDRTHLFVASYPCQPFSAAGKRQGADDERHLWPYVYRWILRARPLLVFLENVEGHISLGLSTVISDLEEGGYKTAWGVFSAAEVGAPHERKRVFILAALGDAELSGLERHFRSDGDEKGPEDQNRPTAKADICHWRRVVFADECRQCEDCDEVICPRCEAHYAECACPGPTQDGIEFVECGEALYGRPETGWPNYPAEQQKTIEPPRTLAEGKYELGGNVDGLANRVDRARLLGNGVVPATAERAFCVLFSELTAHNTTQ